MIEAGTSKPAPFDVAIVQWFGRFFRDHSEPQFYFRKLAKKSNRTPVIPYLAERQGFELTPR